MGVCVHVLLCITPSLLPSFPPSLLPSLPSSLFFPPTHFLPTPTCTFSDLYPFKETIRWAIEGNSITCAKYVQNFTYYFILLCSSLLPIIYSLSPIIPLLWHFSSIINTLILTSSESGGEWTRKHCKRERALPVPSKSVYGRPLLIDVTDSTGFLPEDVENEVPDLQTWPFLHTWHANCTCVLDATQSFPVILSINLFTSIPIIVKVMLA